MEAKKRKNSAEIKSHITENIYSDNESYNEKPRKKKKKPIVTENNQEGKKKSIRQMKREKFAQRQAEAQATSKDNLKQQCLSYLSQWKHAKDHWKFMKTKQVWLFKNKFSSQYVPDESWPLLLEYFQSSKGNIRSMLLEDSNKIIEQMDKYLENENSLENTQSNEMEDDKTATEITKPDETSYKRARDVIQHLVE